MRGADEDLAGHSRLRDGLVPGGGAIRGERDDGHAGAVHRPAHAHAVAGPCHGSGGGVGLGGADLFEADVGDGQRLGHPVRGVQRGPGQQPLHLREEGCGDGRAGGEQQLHAPQGLVPGPAQAALGRKDVAQRRGRGEDHRGVDGRGGVPQRAGRQSAGHGDVHGGRHRDCSERRSQQGERREACHQARARADPQRRGHGIPHRGQLPVRIQHALGRTGGAGGEEHGGGGVRVPEPRPGRSPRRRLRAEPGSAAGEGGEGGFDGEDAAAGRPAGPAH